METEWISQIDKLGQIGPDEGIVLFDEILPDIGRVMIEKKKRKKIGPNEFFAVSIFVFNQFFDTSYYRTWEDALEHTKSVKMLILAISGSGGSG
jgi:hypothetical protein